MQNDPSVPQWLRAAEAARRMGLGPRMFHNDLTSGRIPVRTAIFGAQRVLHVEAGDFARYVRALTGAERNDTRAAA